MGETTKIITPVEAVAQPHPIFKRMDQKVQSQEIENEPAPVETKKATVRFNIAHLLQFMHQLGRLLDHLQREERNQITKAVQKTMGLNEKVVGLFNKQGYLSTCMFGLQVLAGFAGKDYGKIATNLVQSFGQIPSSFIQGNQEKMRKLSELAQSQELAAIRSDEQRTDASKKEVSQAASRISDEQHRAKKVRQG